MIEIEKLRFEKTLKFVSKHISKDSQLMDLGTPNDMSEFLLNNDYKVESIHGFDFDLDPEKITNYNGDVFTAFEVLEHLVSPLKLLQDTSANKLIVTVPLKLWFAKAYRNINDPYDQHFHEFEDWQLDMLLEKASWKIIDREYWIPNVKLNGFRSILRKFTPRYYAVYAEKI